MTHTPDGQAVPAIAIDPLLLPRVDRAPVDQWDYDDRHETRATSDDRTLRRYVAFGWHRTAQRLVPIVFLAIFFIAAIVVLAHTVPGLSIRGAVFVATAGIAAIAGGGYGVAAGQARRRRRTRRR